MPNVWGEIKNGRDFTHAERCPGAVEEVCTLYADGFADDVIKWCPECGALRIERPDGVAIMRYAEISLEKWRKDGKA